MNGRNGGPRGLWALALLLLVLSFLPACGRKAKPEPRWGKAAPVYVRFLTR